MNGKWIVECQDVRGNWYPLKGEYETPSPAEGGSPEMVILEEREAAYNDSKVIYLRDQLRAEWVEE